MMLLAERAGVFGETAAGVAIGALLEAVRRGQLRVTTRLSSWSPATGSRRPSRVERFQPIEIGADADAVLEQLGVAS